MSGFPRPDPSPEEPSWVDRPGGPVGGLRPRPSATWRWWQALLLYLLGSFVGGAIAAAALQGVALPTLILVATLAGQVTAIMVLLAWLERSHPGWRSAVGLPRRWLREAGYGAVAGLLGYTVGVFVVGTALALVLQLLSGSAVEPPEQLPSDLGGGRVGLAMLAALVGAPVAEELAFRGLVFRAIRDRHGLAPALVVSSLLFAGAHYVGGPWTSAVFLMGVMVFVGVAFGLLYERRGNIVANISAHAAFNLFGFVMIVVLDS